MYVCDNPWGRRKCSYVTYCWEGSRSRRRVQGFAPPPPLQRWSLLCIWLLKFVYLTIQLSRSLMGDFLLRKILVGPPLHTICQIGSYDLDCHVFLTLIPNNESSKRYLTFYTTRCHVGVTLLWFWTKLQNEYPTLIRLILAFVHKTTAICLVGKLTLRKKLGFYSFIMSNF